MLLSTVLLLLLLSTVLVMLENRFPTLMLMGDDNGDGLFVMRESNFPLL